MTDKEPTKVSSCCGVDWELSVACSPIKPNQRIKICLNCGKSCQLVDKPEPQMMVCPFEWCPAQDASMSCHHMSKHNEVTDGSYNCSGKPSSLCPDCVPYKPEPQPRYECNCGDGFNTEQEYKNHRWMCHGEGEPASINLDEIMPLVVNRLDDGMPFDHNATGFKRGSERQNQADKQAIQPILDQKDAEIAELKARLARSVELTQDEAEILITCFENESMRRYGKVSEQVPVLAKLKARLEVQDE